ncbi:DUF3888 domain-containing protein [Cohnella endophytica]|nr:DUF3888 domain-containing protein [Cohnella endophytica]
MIKLITIYAIPFFCSIFFAPHANATPTNAPCQRLVLTLLAPEIQAQIEKYYSAKLTVTPEYAPYLGGNRLEIERFDSHIDVVVTVIPYVGPHLDVGIDKMKFQIDNAGKVSILSYEHIKDSELPPNWMYIKR